MPIEFTSESAGNTNFVRVNLPQNRWTLKTENGDEPIDMTRGIAIDVANVVFGWLHIDVGVRDWQPWPSPSQQIAKPSDQHKKGFEVDCWMGDGRAAQFSGNSYGLGTFIAKLYNTAEEDKENFATKIPVVQCTSSTPVVIGKGTSYDVGFTIAKWIDRPAQEEAAVSPSAAAPAPAQPTPAPAPEPAPAAAPTGGSDFGF